MAGGGTGREGEAGRPWWAGEPPWWVWLILALLALLVVVLLIQVPSPAPPPIEPARILPEPLAIVR